MAKDLRGAVISAVEGIELAKAMRRFDHLPPSEREAIEAFSKSLMNKFLHDPTVRLREAAVGGRGLGIVDALSYLFALDARAADQVAPPSSPESSVAVGLSSAEELTTSEER